MADDIILVDENDQPIGTGEKLAVHRAGQLHRCFSVFIFNNHGKLLLQKRNANKYHSGGLWTNTTCSHPRPNEETKAAAERRLQEEMGITCPLTEQFTFIYRAEFSNGITEHEYDHVFFGTYNKNPKPDPAEAEDWRWVDLPSLQQDIAKHPEHYTVWLKTCLDRVKEHAPEPQKSN